MADHTPVPWNSIGGYIYDVDDPMPIASVLSRGKPASEFDANVRLITAAPETAEQRDELLAALEGIVAASRKGKCIEGCGGHTTGLCSRLCRQVAAAIARAKGE